MKNKQVDQDDINYCKECGGFIEWDMSTLLLSHPPKHKGECKDCGEIEYAFQHQLKSN